MSHKTLDFSISSEEVSNIVSIQGCFLELASPSFYKVVADSAFVNKGCLFVYSGHEVTCITDATLKGATVIYNSSRLKNKVNDKNAYFTESKSPFRNLIGYVRKKSKAKFISVTGSVGKSTVKEMLGHVLSGFGSTVTNKGNRNGGNGIVEALGRVTNATQYAVLEVASAAPGSILKRNKVIKPDIAVITFIGESHLQNYSSKADLLKEKISLLDDLNDDGVGIISRKIIDDFPNALQLIEEKGKKVLVIGGDGDDLYLKGLEKNSTHMCFKVVCLGKEYEVELNSIAKHDADNVLFSFAVGHVLKLGLNQIAASLSSFNGVGRRLERVAVELKDGRKGLLVDDSFNSSPTAVKGAIEAVSHLDQYRRKVFLFGDMLEISENAEAEHIEIAEFIKENGFSLLVTVGQTSKSMSVCSGGAFQVKNFDSYVEATSYLIENMLSDDLVLIKGSHATELYKVTGEIKNNSHVKSVKKLK
ncbi:Mur ligase family protein [Halomonas sp. AOP42-A1-14]|uniref:Mur ligase family protein n=1 Tax=Halomonas sp. AOP42-A1-14 TaxID=3457676 RepID=UPI0040347F4D